jgi:lipoyl(octanoyl) transferase
MMPDESRPLIATGSGRAEVIVDEAPMSGRFNMAMDAAMLELGSTRDVSVVRIYRWCEPTVSVGYFQGAGDRHESPFPGLPTVRRLSGGGAILHDLEITYSCTLPASHPVRQDPSELYGIVHRSLIRLLGECGVKCLLRSDFDANQTAKLRDRGASENENARSSAEPFLCFLRSNPNDIVHESGIKIVGSAQRRRKGITLQHGSILLSASAVCPTVEGIQQLSQEFNSARFFEGLPGAIAASIEQDWIIRRYSELERSISSDFLSDPAYG